VSLLDSLSPGEAFGDLVRSYLVSGLTRGVPSLFVDLKGLYGEQSKRQKIEEIIEEVREKLTSSNCPPLNGPLLPNQQEVSSSSASSSSSEPPTTYLWTLYFLAQHYSMLGNHVRALSMLNLAIQHTPTLPELFTCKGRILKHAGDFLGATRCLDEARLLDGQDRFLNTKSAKYRLRAGFIEEANEILGFFTKVS
jgi:tetratricopeptide (TPR) repeat protein